MEGSPSVQASGTNAFVQTKPPRDFLKCGYCRDKKRKCEEYNYEQGERCRSCVAGNKPCGPRVAHSARDLNQTPAATTPTPSTPRTHSSSHASSSLPSSSHSSNSRNIILAPYTPSPAAATPNFITPDSSFQRSRSRVSFSHDVNHDARAPSAKDLIRSKLLQFGFLGDLFETLNDRLNAATTAQPDVGLRPHEEVENMIKSILDLVRERCTHLCEQILDSLPHVTSRLEKDNFLRSFNDKAAYLLALTPSTGQQECGEQDNLNHLASSSDKQQDDFQDMKFMHYFAASQLATSMEDSGDFSEALRQKRRLADLGQRYCIPDQSKETLPTREAFEKLSSGIGEAFKSLRVPTRFARLIPDMDNLFPPAHLAVQRRYAQTAVDLLEAGADPQACDILKRQAIHIAAETGNLSMLQLVLGRHTGAKSARDVFQQTALCIAAYIGDLEIFTHLFKAGGDTSVRDIARRSVLAIASSAGNLSIVQYLLDHGCRPNDTEELQPLVGVPSALHTAARGGHSECVELLLVYRASALMQCHGLTPAQIAEAQGHVGLAARLSSAESEQASHLTNNIHIAEQAFMSNFVNEPFISQMSSTSTSPFAVATGATPSVPLTVGTPLTTSTPAHDHFDEIVRSVSRATSMAMPSPQISSTSPASVLMFSRKRSSPSHRSSPCPSDISSQNSSRPSKRRPTSDLPDEICTLHSQ